MGFVWDVKGRFLGQHAIPDIRRFREGGRHRDCACYRESSPMSNGDVRPRVFLGQHAIERIGKKVYATFSSFVQIVSGRNGERGSPHTE